MNHSQARSPHRDVSGKFVHDSDTKDELEVPLTTNGTSHGPHPSYRHTPDLEGEGNLEGTIAGPDARSAAPDRIIASGDEPILTGLDRTGSRVRFRSRVRISAGLGRRWRYSDGLPSNASSISGSPSSSISAPLRTHYTGNNAWGPLGSRVKFSASQATPISPHRDDDTNGGKRDSSGNGDRNARRRCARSSWTFLDDDADESTHLLMSGARHSYVGRYYVRDSCDDERERERERWWREQLVDEAFGKWPGRLLNRHWWWWHLEPILCCFCEPDEEE